MDCAAEADASPLETGPEVIRASRNWPRTQLLKGDG